MIRVAGAAAPPRGTLSKAEQQARKRRNASAAAQSHIALLRRQLLQKGVKPDLVESLLEHHGTWWRGRAERFSP